ncbi:hypothetical protein A3F37_00225 [Candidatus Saccharibacteria bacterium RIFCSPHIGHO2_12_FULL_41_12]|nr:MAG: hypothetical protein A3F37_00225 [Candidatus Saccharibacteria bacterium RIFCSPHIGHO2_12_FULL_41_12]
MKYKIGVYGSAAGEIDGVVPKIIELGNALKKHADSVIVITGACKGLPYIAAKQAHSGGVEIWGYSPLHNMDELKHDAPDDDHNIYAKLQFVSEDFEFVANKRVCMKYRNVILTANCDAGIIIRGRWGSLNEFTNLIDMQKVVGVLTDTGGVADELVKLNQKITKEGQGKIIFDEDPTTLIEKVLDELGS